MTNGFDPRQGRPKEIALVLSVLAVAPAIGTQRRRDALPQFVADDIGERRKGIRYRMAEKQFIPEHVFKLYGLLAQLDARYLVAIPHAEQRREFGLRETGSTAECP